MENNTSSTNGSSTEVEGAISDDTGYIVVRYLIVVAGAVGLILTSVIFSLFLARYKGRWTKHLILLVNILICDIGISLSAVIMHLSYIIQIYLNDKREQLDPSADQLLGERISIVHTRLGCVDGFARILWSVSTDASFFAFALLAVDHLVAVRWSVRHATAIPKRWVIISCVVSWLIATALGCLTDVLIALIQTPDHFYAFKLEGVTDYCYKRAVYLTFRESRQHAELFKYDRNDKISYISGTVVILSTFVVMLVSYTYVVKAVISFNKRRKSMNNKYRERHHNAKGIGTTLLLLASFIFLYSPSVVVYLLQSSVPKVNVGNLWLDILTLAASTSPIVDVVIYFARNKEIKAVLCQSHKRGRDTRRSSSRRSSRKTATTLANRTPSPQLREANEDKWILPEADIKLSLPENGQQHL